MEQHFIQTRLLEKGVQIRALRTLKRISPGCAEISCVYTGRTEEVETDAVVLVTSRIPVDGIAADLARQTDRWSDAGLEDVKTIGDALAPATIAHAVYAGRRYAEELDSSEDAGDNVPFRRDVIG